MQNLFQTAKQPQVIWKVVKNIFIPICLAGILLLSGCEAGFNYRYTWKWNFSELSGNSPDCTGNRRSLVGANFHATNLSGQDLSRADLSGADLSGANLRGTNLQCTNLSGADLSNADLRGANLTSAKILGTKWQGADVTGAVMPQGKYN